MNIKHIIDRLDEIEQNTPTIKKYIVESVYNAPEMTKHWRKLDEGFVKGYSQYLNEVALTPDQIQNIFKQASGSASGEAPKDPGKLAALVDKVLPASQAANLEKSLPEPDAGPVQGFEQKAGAAIQNLGVDSGTKQSLMQLIKAGVSKPETQQLILAAVGAGLGSLISKVGPILSMIPGGGPVASAITGAVVAGGVAVLSAKLRGEDWKSAFKGAIKPALMGGAAAVVGNLVTTGISAMMSGGSSQQPADQTAQKGAGVGVGDKMPDGSEVTGLNGGQVTITHPDGTSETMPNTDYYARTGQQGIADPNAAPADSDKPKRQLPQWAQDLQAKQKAIDDFAGKMGLPPGKHDVQMQGGVPVSIDGQPVPQDLYNPQQQRNIQAAQQMSSMMNGGGANQSGAGEFTARPSIQPASNAPIGQNFDPGIAPIGANGQPMRQVPMDDPIPAGATPTDNVGSYVQNKSTPGGGYSQTVRQNADPADPRVMASIQAKQDYYKNDPQGQAEYAKIMNAGGSKATFESSLYDKQATLKEWLRRDAKGLPTNSVILYPYVVEGIMDSIKGMFGGKKGAEAPAAGSGVTPDALNKAWTDAGSPTDSDEVAKLLQSAGVPAETVTKVFTDLKIPAPGASPESPKDPAATPTPASGETPPVPDGEKPADATAPDATTPPDELADIKKNAGLSTTPPTDATTPAPTTGSVDPATSAAVEPPPTPQAEKQSKVGVGQINKVIPTLRVRDLTSVQKTVDNTLAKRQSTKQPTAEGKYVGVYSNFLGRDI